MRRNFLNARVYAKLKINLTWPYVERAKIMIDIGDFD